MKKISKKGRAARQTPPKPAARELPPDVQRYLTTLRRIPVRVRRSMATREFEMDSGTACLCGWAVRESVVASTGKDVTAAAWTLECTERFGGSVGDWADIYYGVIGHGAPAIEEAFTIAVAETVR